MILGLDLGTHTGYAWRSSAGKVNHGHVNFATAPGIIEGGGMRHLRFRRWLVDFCSVFGWPKSIYFEQVRAHKGTIAAHMYGGFMFELAEWCEGRDPPIPFSGIHVGTIKKHIAGRGNASKEEMMAAVKALGYDVTDENEADALGVLLTATFT